MCNARCRCCVTRAWAMWHCDTMSAFCYHFGTFYRKCLCFMSVTKPFFLSNFLSFLFYLSSSLLCTAHWQYTVLARKTRLSTSVSLKTAPAPHRQVPASQCSGLMDCLVCPPTCRLKPSHPPPSRCPGRSQIRTLRTSLAMCSTSAGLQVRLHGRAK